MVGLPWYAHSIEDYERKTSHLTMLEHGAYRLMMDHYYKLAKALPAKLEQVQRICRAFDEQEKLAVSAVLNEFFDLGSDGWHNHRADVELARMAEISEKRSNSAKNRGPLNKPATNAHANAGANAPSNAPASMGATEGAVADTLNTEHISSLRSDIAPPKKKPASELFVLPDWIDPNVWAAFLEVRKKRRAANTDYALGLLVKTLEELREHGHDPTELINKSIKSGWSDIYEPKENANGSRNSEKRSSTDKHLDGIASLIAERRQIASGNLG